MYPVFTNSCTLTPTTPPSPSKICYPAGAILSHCIKNVAQDLKAYTPNPEYAHHLFWIRSPADICTANFDKHCIHGKRLQHNIPIPLFCARAFNLPSTLCSLHFSLQSCFANLQVDGMELLYWWWVRSPSTWPASMVLCSLPSFALLVSHNRTRVCMCMDGPSIICPTACCVVHVPTQVV